MLTAPKALLTWAVLPATGVGFQPQTQSFSGFKNDYTSQSTK
ncbi:hypothetical protein CHK_2214 [Christensenella hongkongensis]|uniref:Uncharacterized protein n=1 Tax=Christensenella hongkongensis TaxID=270498 RepID=A0A0M2NGS2_9FIRM|nr:hypothetical protein CHK_2214 [Christensenella hongkongensis]